VNDLPERLCQGGGKPRPYPGVSPPGASVRWGVPLRPQQV